MIKKDTAIIALMILAAILLVTKTSWIDKKAIRAVVDHEIEMERLRGFLEYGSRERQSFQDSIDFLLIKISERDSAIIALDKRIEKREKDYKNEIKTIPTWSSARRDSFWRVESAR
jgi:hypothetical protein